MKEQVILWCDEEDVVFTNLTPYQSRLIKGLVVCDIYWKRMRYHLIRHTEGDMIQKRGNVGEVDLFLESVFSNY